MNKKKLMAYIRLERPQYSFVVYLITCAGVTVALGSFPDNTLLLGVGFIFWMVLNTAHPTNDYFDREIDKFARPDAPIPSGDLSPEEAKKSVILHYMIVPLLIILIASVLPVERVPLIVVAFFGLTLTVIYSVPPIHTRRGLLKDPTAGLSFPISFLGGWVAVKGWSINAEVLMAFCVYFLLTVCASVLADIHDIKGEKPAGCKTLPIRIGIKNTFYFSFFLTIVSILLILMLLFMKWLNIYFVILGLFAIFWLIFLYVGSFINFDPEKGRELNQKVVIGVILYTMAIIFGSV